VSKTIVYYLLVLWYWIANIGPWYVIGHWVDDEGRIRRFRTAYDKNFTDRKEAGEYADRRNDRADIDPLGTIYYVWHKTEWGRYLKENP
jgi:hypothetical protein